ncbi:hypothetical protein Sru01_08200 [Sphaerisporangium rufum]|uniref:Low molecular weight protein antigen 6 PH domain-containing protein n=1 Tax=Sphaerisporangium rufum TaxID=1381558 RepID=A0A919UZQ5_9ACTN|nr:PH domain-containing protein [Sphaerisporangium rufum]GII75838.1 hypothetical protein Sru01_08200 [Sphaerisporangium rufum]
MTAISGRQWRVRRELTMVKWAATAALAVLAVAVAIGGDVRGTILCAGGTLMLGGFVLRDVLAPVRLAADEHGVTVVTGLARRRRLPWPEIAAIRVEENARYGLRWDVLEIETTESLHLFSAHELGTPCRDAARELDRLRPG